MWGILKLENTRKKENDYMCISFFEGDEIFEVNDI